MVDAAPLTAPQPPAGSMWQTTFTNYGENQDQVSNTTNAGTSANRPYFTANQEAMQGQAMGLMNRILTGNVQEFGLPRAAYESAWYDFNKQQMPQLSAIYGSGSPVINSAQQELQLHLAGLSGRMAMPQAMDAFRALGSFAFQPTGNNTVDSRQQQTNTATDTTGYRMENTINSGGLLGSLLQGLGGMFW